MEQGQNVERFGIGIVQKPRRPRNNLQYAQTPVFVVYFRSAAGWRRLRSPVARRLGRGSFA